MANQTTFEQYLRDNLEKNVIDFSLRATFDHNGTKIVQFYIHPAYVDGDTVDFCVTGNTLVPVKFDTDVPNKQKQDANQ